MNFRDFRVKRFLVSLKIRILAFVLVFRFKGIFNPNFRPIQSLIFKDFKKLIFNY